MGNSISANGDLPDKNTPFGAFIRKVASETKEADKRDATFDREYNVHLKRACCLGALNKSNIDSNQAKYIEYPLPYFNSSSSSRCPLDYTLDESTENIILYKKGEDTIFSMEYLSEDKKQYKFYAYLNNTKNSIPEFKKELNEDDAQYEYKYRKGQETSEDEMTIRYIEKLEPNSDGYKYFSKEGHPIGSEDNNIIRHLENKDTPMSLKECLVRKSLKLDLYAPDNITTDDELKDYCNKEPITLEPNKTSWADVSLTSSSSNIDPSSDCPNFMSYYCGKALKDQGCIKITTVTRNGTAKVKGSYNYGNKFCVTTRKGENESGSYSTQLRDCQCINSGLGPNLNNTYDPRKFTNEAWPKSFQKEDGTKDETKDPYGIISQEDLTKQASEIRQKFLIEDEMLGKNYISNYAINVNEQRLSSQTPWATDSNCSTDLGSTSSDYRSNPFIPAEARVTQNVTVCNAQMNFQNLEVGNSANIYGNKMINLCGTNVNDDFLQQLDSVFNNPTGNAIDQKDQNTINEIESDYQNWLTNTESIQRRVDELEDEISTKTLILVTADLSQLRSDKTRLESYTTQIENSKNTYESLKNTKPNLLFNKELADFDTLISQINNITKIDDVITLYENKKTELEAAADTSDTGDTDTGTADTGTAGTADTGTAGTADTAGTAGATGAATGATGAATGAAATGAATGATATGAATGATGAGTATGAAATGAAAGAAATTGAAGAAATGAEDQLIEGIDNMYLYLGGGLFVLIIILLLVVILSGGNRDY